MDDKIGHEFSVGLRPQSFILIVPARLLLGRLRPGVLVRVPFPARSAMMLK